MSHSETHIKTTWWRFKSGDGTDNQGAITGAFREINWYKGTPWEYPFWDKVFADEVCSLVPSLIFWEVNHSASAASFFDVEILDPEDVFSLFGHVAMLAIGVSAFYVFLFSKLGHAVLLAETVVRMSVAVLKISLHVKEKAVAVQEKGVAPPQEKKVSTVNIRLCHGILNLEPQQKQQRWIEKQQINPLMTLQGQKRL
ncbi:hypothetical protein K435DRAFT_800253 [Dendrothele bispora CBS 962.96]|uniref:Uncharacterized protein n=1 Tax=Dendrothele bispora (strain CBS 962.96) TaxID=1314807 RepID=A0A4V4HEX3_DENBC|nr:hypothetical protein K435DRAFT_800253 [Dendrothele bispora CBS 962.96]